MVHTKQCTGFFRLCNAGSTEPGRMPCRINWKSKKKKKKKGTDNRLDLYALLGLQNERWTATDAQIKLGELS